MTTATKRVDCKELRSGTMAYVVTRQCPYTGRWRPSDQIVVATREEAEWVKEASFADGHYSEIIPLGTPER